MLFIDEQDNNEIVEIVHEGISSGCLEDHVVEQVVDGDRDLSFDGDCTFSFTNGSNLSIFQEVASKEDVKNEFLNLAKASFEFPVENSNKTVYVVRCVNDKFSWRVWFVQKKDS